MREVPTIEEPVPVLDLTPEAIDRLSAEIRALAAERNAVILAYNYQVPELQDLADFVGDSLGPSRQAAATDAEVIAFCGVHFMGKTASIIAPEKSVAVRGQGARGGREAGAGPDRAHGRDWLN